MEKKKGKENLCVDNQEISEDQIARRLEYPYKLAAHGKYGAIGLTPPGTDFPAITENNLKFEDNSEKLIKSSNNEFLKNLNKNQAPLFTTVTALPHLKDILNYYGINLDYFCYMLQTTTEVQSESPAIKRKVGASIIECNRDGLNKKSYSGFNHINIDGDISEICEDENGITKPYVIHAEEAVIFRFLQYENPIVDKNQYYMIATFSPCANCAKMIVQSGIKILFFIDEHVENFRNKSSLDTKSVQEYLFENKIEMYKIDRYFLGNIFSRTKRKSKRNEKK